MCDCSSRPFLISSQEDLRALECLANAIDSAFRLLVAGRPDSRIRMAFHQLSSRAESIHLNEKYSPEKDIRLFVTAEFDGIKAAHPSAHLLPGDCPAASDIEAIVQASSGLRIYATTVMQYSSCPSIVPNVSLHRVKCMVPLAGNSVEVLCRGLPVLDGGVMVLPQTSAAVRMSAENLARTFSAFKLR